MVSILWALGLIVPGLCGACAALPPPAPAAPPPLLLHVDAAAAPGGDGSARHPWRRLEQALQGQGPRRIRVAAGLYRGPFQAPEGTQLEGPPEAVLHAEGAEAVVLAGQGALSLQGLTLQGGGWALSGAGPLRLQDTVLSGQRRGCLHLRGGSLEAHGARFAASVSERSCLVLEEGASARLVQVHFAGPWQRALQVPGQATLTVEDARVEGAVTALDQRGGQVTLRRVQVEGGRGPALYVLQGALTLEDVTVRGHEYGLLTGRGARVVARRLTSHGAERAGVAVVQAEATLEDLVVADSGNFAGVQLMASQSTLRRFTVLRAQAAGVSIIGGRALLEGGRIQGVRESPGGAEGEALVVRRAEARVRDVLVQQADSVALLVAEGARVQVDALEVEGGGLGGLAAETRGEVRAGRLSVRGTRGSALLVAGDGVAEVGLLESEGNAEGALWAECQEGARVRLGQVRGEGLGRVPVPCLERLAGAR